jgi:ribosomal protein S11
MAYVTSNPPKLIAQALGGGAGKLWQYRSTDAAATVDTANYFTNGGSLGMAVGDLVFVVNTTGNITTLHQVSATGDGTTDVNDLTTITQTDSD